MSFLGTRPFSDVLKGVEWISAEDLKREGEVV